MYTGTTAVAAERLHRHWLGSEISADYYNIAMGRLVQLARVERLKLTVT